METILWVYPMNSKKLLSEREALVKGRMELGQVQILAIFLFLLLIPTTVIIAQNSTINSTFTGDIIDEIPTTNETALPEDTGNDTATDTIEEDVNITIEDNETQETPPENTTQEINETIETPSNQTNETGMEENVTIPDELNQTVNETVINETIINQTLTNETETNETIEPEPVIPETNETINETLNETINETIPNETLEFIPILDVGIISPEKITRGYTFEMSAYAKNIGSASAMDVSIEWILPDGFVILSGSGSVNCQEVAPKTSCWNNLTATVSLSSNLGLNDIRVRVSYSE